MLSITYGQLDISENECRDVAVLRLYKDFGQRIIHLWRCLLPTLTPSSSKTQARTGTV
ncbi:MAG: hypothetical protein KME54_02740 [Tolypothrix brevis GSE-NOS-MK-07-07A]|nr:hypothetical protein [Tolypothrix brevis GSE-NOS-MK-07-07A]